MQFFWNGPYLAQVRPPDLLRLWNREAVLGLSRHDFLLSRCFTNAWLRPRHACSVFNLDGVERALVNAEHAADTGEGHRFGIGHFPRHGDGRMRAEIRTNAASRGNSAR